MKTQLVRVLSAGLMALLIPLGAGAQTTGDIRGAVVDATGAPLPGASVEIRSPAMQGIRIAVTDADGRFRISAVPPGNYTVTATLQGFGAVQRTATVALDTAAEVPIRMEIAVAREVVVTGEVPVVDTTGTTSGTNYTADAIAHLPLGRNYADAVRLQPGVQVDNGETQGRSLALSVYGSTSAENLWLIDGVNTTNVIKGIQGKAINNEFIEEIEVKTGGYQAEYGRNTGGVVNVITKQGGNEFHGNAFGYYDSASTSAAKSNVQTPPYAQDGDVAATVSYPTNTRYEIGASIGGYLWKDRLWFFGAYDHVTVDQKVQPEAGIVAGQQFPARSRSDLWSGKLTWRITDATELQGTAFADPQTDDGALQVPFSTDPGTFEGARGLGGTDVSARLTQLTGNWGLAVLQYARHEDQYTLVVANALRVNDQTAAVLSGVPLTAYGGWGNVFGPTNNNSSVRDSWRASMSFFLGSHELKVGGDHQKDVTSGSSYYSGGQSLGVFPCIRGQANYNCDLAKAPVVATAAGLIPVFYRHNYYAASWADRGTPVVSLPFAAQSASSSAFVQDEWRVLPGLTLNFGVRYDEQTIYKGDGTVGLDLRDQWSPRLGFSWDFLNDGSSKLYGSAGRFHYNTPTDLNIRSFTAYTGIATFNYSPVSVTQDPTAPRRITGIETTVEGEPVDSGLKQAYQDEFTIGVEKALDPTFSLGARFTYRTLGRTIEDRGDLDWDDPASQGSSYWFINPGGSGPAASGQISVCNGSENPTDPTAGACGLPGVPVPAAKRIYRGVELTARKRVGESLWLQASYVYSSLKGNYSGAISTPTGQTDPGINADFDYYQFVDNAYGPLELDHPHSFRVDGAWTTPFGLQAGLSFWVRSGAPMSRMGFFNSSYPRSLFLEPRGSLGRTPTEWDADVSLAYNWKVGPVVVTPQVFFFRVFDNQQVTRFNTSFNPNGAFVTNKASPFYGQAGVEPGTGNCPSGGGPCPDNPDYMKAVARSSPRQIRFAVKVAF